MEDDMNVSGKEAKTLLKDEVMDEVEQRLEQIDSNDETFMTKRYHTHNPEFKKLDQTVLLEQNEDTNLGVDDLIEQEEYKLKYLAARNVIRKLIAEKNDSTTTKKDEGSVEKLQARVAELEDKLKEKQKSSELQLKVDVWSAGVLLFQMLYGKQPFCEGKSALTIWNERAIINAPNLTFPEFSIVSDEAKAFMRRCLTYEKDQRPDVIELSEDPYLHYLGLVQ